MPSTSTHITEQDDTSTSTSYSTFGPTTEVTSATETSTQTTKQNDASISLSYITSQNPADSVSTNVHRQQTTSTTASTTSDPTTLAPGTLNDIEFRIRNHPNQTHLLIF